MKKITVFGATGMLGQPVVKELVNAGFEVTAMIRSPEKARQVLPETVNLVWGDLENSNDIEKALDGAEGIYLNLSTKPESGETDFQPELDGLKNVIEGAKKNRRQAHCLLLIAYPALSGNERFSLAEFRD